MSFWGSLGKAFSAVTGGFKESFEHLKDAFNPKPYTHDRVEDNRYKEDKADYKEGSGDIIIKPDTEQIYDEWLITKSTSSVFMEFSDFFQEGKSP